MVLVMGIIASVDTYSTCSGNSTYSSNNSECKCAIGMQQEKFKGMT